MKNHGSSKEPSMEALLKARYRPHTTGSVSRMGTHPASGLTWLSSYRRLISTFMRSVSFSYFLRTASTCGCRFCRFSELSICVLVNGYVSALTVSVVKMMAEPSGYGTPCSLKSACAPSTNSSRRSDTGDRMPSMRCGPVETTSPTAAAASDVETPFTACRASAKAEEEPSIEAEAEEAKSAAIATSDKSARRCTASAAAASTCGAKCVNTSPTSPGLSAATGAAPSTRRRRSESERTLANANP
mmetsp:Transcript_39608/g.63523  ORF Transcript_39608/g.63523 Transcript_39608/m.63523 type:complete len:244 (-) Transcript_39608:239-970(-)